MIPLPGFFQFNFSLFQSQGSPLATIQKSWLIGTFFLLNNLQGLSCEYVRTTKACVFIFVFIVFVWYINVLEII